MAPADALKAGLSPDRLKDAISRAVSSPGDPNRWSSPAETAACAAVAALGALLAAVPRSQGLLPRRRLVLCLVLAQAVWAFTSTTVLRAPVARFDAVRDLVARQHDAITSAVLASSCCSTAGACPPGAG